MTENILEKKYMRKGREVGSYENSFYIQLGESKGEVYELSPAVYYVWRMSNGNMTVQELIQHASKELEIEEEKLRQPIIDIIEKLSEANLIEETK